MSASSRGKSKLYIIFKTKTGDTTLHQEIVSSSSMVYPDITIDLQAKLGYPPNNLPDFLNYKLVLPMEKIILLMVSLELDVWQ